MTHACPNCECGGKKHCCPACMCDMPPKPLLKQRYFYIKDTMEVDWMGWSNDDTDNALYAARNLFLSESDCQSACEKVRELLASLKAKS